jgi:radical SAM protein with 4Fe4S-binding SPASM domain
MYLGVRDSFELLRSFMRPSRAVNLLKVRSSHLLTRIVGRSVQWGYPVAAGIEPTTACNLGCPQCPSGLKSFSRPTGKLPLNQFKSMLDKLSSHIGYVTLYFQGEPYINKEFTDMVAEASAKGIYTATSSNAHFLTPENSEKTVKSGLKRLIISIDGTDQATYEKYRIDGQLDKVLIGTKNLMAARKRMKKNFPRVVWQFIVFKHNEGQIDQIKQLAKEYGVDKLALKTAQIYDYENAEDWLPSSALSRYATQQGEITLKASSMKHCSRLWSSPVLTWDGEMVPCCFDKDADNKMGNLVTDSLEQIWHGKKYSEFRNKIVSGRKNIEICKNCSEGVRVWI